MARLNELVALALRRLGVVGSDEAAQAADIQAGVDAYNLMVAGWAARNLDAVPGAGSDPAPIGSADTVPMVARYHDAIVILLAARMAPAYGVADPEPEVTRHWWRVLRGALLDAATASIEYDSALTRTPTQLRRRFS
jgi:hypothetical protein